MINNNKDKFISLNLLFIMKENKNISTKLTANYKKKIKKYQGVSTEFPFDNFEKL